MIRRHALAALTVPMLLASATLLTGAGMDPPDKGGRCHNLVHNPRARVHGQSLGAWLEDYWRWFYTGGAAATEPYQPGRERLVFMPIPAGEYISGSFTADDPGVLRGEIHVEMRHGTSFVLPAFSWVTERYNNGQIDDPAIPNRFIECVATNIDGDDVPEFTINGEDLLDDFWDYYIRPREFDPIVEYPEPSSYGSIAATGFQGVGFVTKPLPRGRYVLHLLERLTVTNDIYPGYPLPINLGIVYDNTWVIDVR